MEAERIGKKRWKILKVRLGFMRWCSSRSAFHPSVPLAAAPIVDDDDDGEIGILPDDGEIGILPSLQEDHERKEAAPPAAVEDDAWPRCSMVSSEEGAEEERGGELGGGGARLCCVCMGRPRGAAFIPCGHTFCRLCARELWMSRGNCPLCNHPIFDILDIF
ncbi:hypothetical protein Cni_G06962 [Canna indica]|uniref:RING-type domain-containing protein n=1 Tax=Canna indica TaxID=4628 RepID=A0AAQ3K0B2_9LILI|nr:hypothetical protein Cni_G06962 [Canna indica]